MTDGKQTIDDKSSDLATDILFAAVQPLKEKGVRVISLGIGPNAQLLDLLTLASTDNDVYLAQDFTELRNLVTDLTERKCPGKFVYRLVPINMCTLYCEWQRLQVNSKEAMLCL